MKHSKQHAVVNFTIHTLRLPSDIADPFQIEFKRGSTTGMTEKSFITSSDNEISFEKHFRCAVTLIKSSNDQEFRKKKIAFSIYRFRGTSRKTFGKFQVDATQYLTQKTDTFEVESAHSKKSYAILTIHLNFTKSGTSSQGNTMTEADLTSQSEAIQLVTDRQDEWDVSDMITPEKKEEIQKFFLKREAEKNQYRSSLSEFTAIKDRKGHRQRQVTRVSTTGLLSVVKQSNLVPGEPSNANRLNSFLKPPLSPSKKKVNTIDSFLTPKSPISHHEKQNHNSKEIISSVESLHPEKESQNIKKDTKTITVHQDKSPIIENTNKLDENQALIFLKSILVKHWDQSPLNMAIVPITVSVITASLLNVHIFESNYYDQEVFTNLVEEFMVRFQHAAMIEHATSLEKWLTTLYLYSSIFLLKNNIQLDQIKIDQFCAALDKVCSKHFDIYMNECLEQFEIIANKFIAILIDANSAAKMLHSCINDLKETINFCDESIQEFIVSQVLHNFDLMLLRTVIESPSRCTFQNAAVWNTENTILSDDPNFNFNIFRQTASVFMMSIALCSDPGLKEDVCPDLSTPIVYQLLKSQKVDDFLPEPNDVTIFKTFFGLNDEDLNIEVSTEYSGSFEALAMVFRSEKWMDAKFSADTSEVFPFLSNYFVIE
ncbi:hypothetical protein TRFO_10533 [Tritrichomonas foetus]|uniref:C2 NT-type domain-containing protein n=1 Tax=Tritrichomonas foetus TaxID=1144522 RepID=A0A1J4JCK9_9EUKA|nr:hypothetical protein TRFO_10533 [Tritrichomonas foetus]|eukprot:OHS95395.1 hypothetical protein TRFO_10533 [Tritrichomonas foetus]